MNELIKITEQNGKKAVSARELHEFLESKQEFANWIKNRIDKCDLIENLDYQVFDNFVKKPNGGRPLTEYALSVDAAKELSMVEGNEKGKQARRYFIACEKAVTSNTYELPKLQDLTEAKIIAADYTIRTLNLNDVSKLALIRAINEPLGLPMPNYVPSKGILKSASVLLTENGLSISSQVFNQKMMEIGYLVEHTRPSSKGGVKKFKSIVGDGLKYGENDVHPNNSKSTQPQYYEDKFVELLVLLQLRQIA